MFLFRNMYRTNGYVEWRSFLFTKHCDVFYLVFLFINLQLTSSISYSSLSWFDSICFYALQIGLRAGLTRHNMVQFYMHFM